MAHSHSHTSSHLPEDNNARRLLYAFGVTAGFMLVEVVGGFLSGSLALLADAGHMLTDTAALLFALLAVQFSRRPPTIRHTFGWLRLTTLAAFVNAIALVVITILIVWEAIERFRTPRPVEGGMMMAIAVAVRNNVARLSRKTRSLLQFLTVTPLFVNYFKILCCVS